jgi:hypothetical protein
LPLVVEDYGCHVEESAHGNVKRCIKNRELKVYCCLNVDATEERLCGATFLSLSGLGAHFKTAKTCRRLFEQRQNVLQARDGKRAQAGIRTALLDDDDDYDYEGDNDEDHDKEPMPTKPKRERRRQTLPTARKPTAAQVPEGETKQADRRSDDGDTGEEDNEERERGG